MTFLCDKHYMQGTIVAMAAKMSKVLLTEYGLLGGGGVGTKWGKYMKKYIFSAKHAHARFHVLSLVSAYSPLITSLAVKGHYSTGYSSLVPRPHSHVGELGMRLMLQQYSYVSLHAACSPQPKMWEAAQRSSPRNWLMTNKKKV